MPRVGDVKTWHLYMVDSQSCTGRKVGQGLASCLIGKTMIIHAFLQIYIATAKKIEERFQDGIDDVSQVFLHFSLFLDCSIFLWSCWKLRKLTQCYVCANGRYVICLPPMQAHLLRRLPMFLAQMSQIWPQADPSTGFGPLFASSWPLSPRYDHQADGLMLSMWCNRAKATSHSPSVLSQVFKWYWIISTFTGTKLLLHAKKVSTVRAHKRNRHMNTHKRKQIQTHTQYISQ